MNSLKVFVLIPYNSLNDVDLNEVKVFDTYNQAINYTVKNGLKIYDVVETTLESYSISNGNGSGFRD